ncbi:hypothetical protein JX265_010194 [Neoarthrinium moseri]|uniref:Diphthamide biosynthesis protein 4 n=1 Tax=Neoarthrinium moseri TaxID=1658444 RepID=A0A9P9WE91_9PEZI|nr:hypothetical protein JX265_010194 [Neoarthrinium moseri]
MAPPKKDQKSKEPTLFEILAITPTSLDGQDSATQIKTVKQAYRRALLKHHPDKNQQAKAAGAPADPQDAASKENGSSGNRSEETFTVDQITHAYTVLSDGRRRREYTRLLQTQFGAATYSSSSSSSTSAPSQSSRNANANANGGGLYTFNVHTSTAAKAGGSGTETVDLDDMRWDGRAQVYHRTCGRCGTKRGYCFRELDLEEVGEEGELMVQCIGCSLWLRVLFAEAEDSDEEAGGAGVGTVQKQNGADGADLKQVRSGSAAGKNGAWTWKLNFGISIGGGASASVKSGRDS